MSSLYINAIWVYGRAIQKWLTADVWDDILLWHSNVLVMTEVSLTKLWVTSLFPTFRICEKQLDNTEHVTAGGRYPLPGCVGSCIHLLVMQTATDRYSTNAVLAANSRCLLGEWSVERRYSLIYDK